MKIDSTILIIGGIAVVGVIVWYLLNGNTGGDPALYNILNGRNPNAGDIAGEIAANKAMYAGYY